MGTTRRGNRAAMFLGLAMAAACAAAGPPPVQAGTPGPNSPIVVMTWGGGQTTRGCYDQTVCRGYGSFDEVNVSVDGVDAPAPAYLDIIVRPRDQRPGCATLNLPGYWEMGVGQARFNNYDYQAGQVYGRVNLCTRGGGWFYGASPGDPVWAWVAPDGSSGTIVVGAELADVNFDGEVGVQDIFDFVDKYLRGDLEADLDGSGDVAVADVFELVAAYFGA